MRFFVPHTSATEAEATYRSIASLLKLQLRLPIVERRIYNLNYANNKKYWYAEVGLLEEQENQYEILAIFESKSYIIYTRSVAGGAGPIIMVDKTQVTDVEDFDA